MMLESDGKAIGKQCPEQLKATAALHAQITREKGAACTEFVCDNAKLQSFVADNLDRKRNRNSIRYESNNMNPARANGKDVVLKEKKADTGTGRAETYDKRVSDWRRGTGGVHWTGCINKRRKSK